MSVRILTGDCREVLARLPAGSVQCCVTSPPYFGLRSYLPTGHSDKAKEVGAEETPDAYVAEMVAVFREVRRVLRDDGTVWLNLGDTIYQKQLQGIPWRVAFALQADGWYLRSEIIWHKKNPMPESVEDRPTKAHEQIFLISKKPRYYYDSHAVSETVYPVRRNTSDRGLLHPKENWEARGDLQNLQQSARIGVASISEGDGKTHCSHGALPSNGGWKGNTETPRNIPAAQGVYEGLFADRERESCQPTREPIPGGQGAAETVFRDREGPRRDQEASRSEKIANGRHDQYADGGGLVGNQGGFSEQVRVLRRPRSPVDTGSCNAAEQRRSPHEGECGSGVQAMQQQEEGPHNRRNLRDVWSLATQPFSAEKYGLGVEHYAVMPPELAETCIKAGSSERGQCPHCGAPWARVVETFDDDRKAYRTEGMGEYAAGAGRNDAKGLKKVLREDGRGGDLAKKQRRDIGWSQSCTCPEHQPVPQTIIDPFAGAGTTGLVADRLQRDAVLIELNPQYADLARERINGEAGLFSPVAAE